MRSIEIPATTFASVTVRLVLLAVTLLGSACGGPGGVGGVGDLSPQALREADAYSAGRGGHSLLVILGGRVVWEQYANGSSAGTPHKVYSGTKSFWAVATLVAAQEGLLGLDEPVSATIAAWRDDRQRKEVTIRNLLSFTSGLAPNFHLHSNSVPDRNAEALSTPVVAARGTAFTYGPSHGQVLCEVLRRKLAARDESPSAYLRRTVLDPLAIGEVDFRIDRMGNPLVASGFKLTARQWAKFGELLLGRGTYKGRVVVKDQQFGELLRGSRANPSFGLGLWLNREAASAKARERDVEEMLELPWRTQDWRGACLCRDAPPDLIASVGSGYQRLFVMPSRQLVIVRQGENAQFSDAEFLRLLLRPEP